MFVKLIGICIVFLSSLAFAEGDETCESAASSTRHLELDALLSPTETPEVLFKRLVEHGYLRALIEEDHLIARAAGLYSEGPKNATLAQFGIGSRDSFGGTGFWAVAHLSAEPVLFVTLDFYVKTRIYYRVTSAELAREMHRRLKEPQFSRVSADSVTVETGYYWVMGGVERLIELENGSLVSGKMDYHIQHASYANPKLWTDPIGIIPLMSWLGYKSEPLNERLGFRYTTPRAKVLNERATELGSHFSHLRFSELAWEFYPQTKKDWSDKINVERPRLKLQQLAQGHVPYIFEDWTQQSLEGSALGAFTLPKKTLQWIQAAARALDASMQNSSSSEDLARLQTLTRTLTQQLAALTRANSSFLFFENDLHNFDRAVSTIYTAIPFLLQMKRMTPEQFAASAYDHNEERNFLDRINAHRDGSALTPEEKAVTQEYVERVKTRQSALQQAIRVAR